MRFRDLFPKKYLSADDFDRSFTATISHISIDTMNDGTKKPVAHWIEAGRKPLVLNKTNATLLAKIAKSDDTDDFGALTVQVDKELVPLRGDHVMGIRLHPAFVKDEIEDELPDPDDKKKPGKKKAA